jgi:HTH-type transcriptional regulator/antitoxin HigA
MFHELGHIILGHIGKIEGLKDSDENVADEFAKNELIPTNIFDEFAKNVELTRENIIEFAKQLGIDAGIVVGRLQKEGYIRFSWYNDLKTKYTISA